MMNRSSKAITLVLVGTTAALAGFGVLGHNTHPAGDDSVETSDFGSDEQGLVGGTQPSTRPGGTRHYVGTPGYSSSRTYSSSRYRSTPFGGSSGSSGTINRSSSSSSSGSSSSHGSGTSRGGFGSSGHAASSGS
jgi:hypothetical protein